MQQDNANYFAVLPSAVRYNANLTSRAKLLYAALTSLSVSNGVAYPSNEYIAQALNVNERTVQRLIAELVEQNYITVMYDYVPGTKEVERRIIKIEPLPSPPGFTLEQSLYAVIPSHILMTELSPQAKLLYAEISAATPTNGYCSKPAAFFAKLFDASETSVHRWTRELIAADALRVEFDYKGDSNEIRNRRVYLTEAAAIAERRRQFAQDGIRAPHTSNQPTESNGANTTQKSRILGGDKNDTTYTVSRSECTKHPNRRRNRRGKRKRLTQKLRE